MRITDNIAWDDRLEEFKGRDTAHYVRTAVSNERACADCGQPFTAGDELSLLVLAQQGDDAANGFTNYQSSVCHRACQPPNFQVQTVPGLAMPTEYDSYGARTILKNFTAFGERLVPTMFFSVLTNVTVRAPGGERTSAYISAYLHDGFQLSLTPDLTDIINHAGPVKDTFRCVITPDDIVALDSGEHRIYTLQLDRKDPHDAQWLDLAATNGTILAVLGENFAYTSTSVELDAAAELGTLVIGTVKVRHDS